MATKRSRIAWICMMMVLESWMMFVRWNLKLWTKVMEEMGVGWSPSYQKSNDRILTISCPHLLTSALIHMNRLICVDQPRSFSGLSTQALGRAPNSNHYRMCESSEETKQAHKFSTLGSTSFSACLSLVVHCLDVYCSCISGRFSNALSTSLAHRHLESSGPLSVRLI